MSSRHGAVTSLSSAVTAPSGNQHHNHSHHRTAASNAEDSTSPSSAASVDHVFDQFVTAVTCKSILSSFHQLLDVTGLRHADQAHFYNALKGKLAASWKAQSLWAKIDKRAAHRDYKRGQACKNMRVLVIGAGPCGLRTAIECALLGARTVVVEKRDRFSRNNVLHLWPYLITDLRTLGAKKFFGKFCAGSIDHISIRQLQCILLKVALLLGVEVHVNVAFEGLVEPTHENGLGWRCNVSPASHAVSEFVFDVLIGADGKRNTLPGFQRKEFRGKLAIAVTANFINRNTQAEARVEEISGVAFIFNQKFFLDLKEKTRIDLENIVYYKDDTHYFVMTAKKASLLEKGVLKEDHADTLTLLDRANVNQEALMAYARQAANFSTNYQLPSLEYAVNHYGQADVAMFDFTSMFAAEHASRFILKNGHHLLMGLVGDSLLEPFWPTGSGCARGFLSAFDAAWMIRSWASGKMTPLQVLAERESIYTVLSQTTPNYLHKNYHVYCIDPNTRYPNLNIRAIKPMQVRHQYEGGDFSAVEAEEEGNNGIPNKKARSNAEEIDSYSLLRWCQRVLNTGRYRNVHIVDFTSSWRSGLALCALIHSFRPELVNAHALMECNIVENNQLGFHVAEKELGIPPMMCAADMAKYDLPDKLTMVAYLSQFYQAFRQDALPTANPVPVRSKRKSQTKDADPKSPRSPNRRISFLQKLSARLAKSKKRKEQEMNEASPLNSKKLKDHPDLKSDVELTAYNKLPMEEIANRLQLDRRAKQVKVSKQEEMSGAISVTAMAEVLSAKFKDLEDKPAPEPVRKLKGPASLLAAAPASEFCCFCHKRVYIMERMSAEGEFFHRGCFKCDHCYVGLRLNNYSFDRDPRNRVKFYCYRHALPELRLRPRKRFLEEESKENVPHTVVHPPPDVEADEASKEKSPRKSPPANLSPLALPKDVADMPKKTPERIEFEISFDGQEEESEEEQFEHNLRASQSSDTLLDDEESDSDSSDLDEGSGAEDDVWESAGENLSPPALPLTLEEACEFVDTWHRTHSQGDICGGSMERERRGGERRRYQRLSEEGNGEEEEEEDDEDDGEDGSSTEVGESDYETDDTSDEDDDDDYEDEEESSSKVHPQIARISSAEGRDRGPTTPTSPSTRLSASKASFFSVPPTVVSLDPWSMFGMGDKKQGHADKGSRAEDESLSEQRRPIEASEESRRGEMSGQETTDISETLESDRRSDRIEEKEGEGERNRRERHISEGGSLEGISEDLNFEDRDDIDEEGEAKREGRGKRSGSDDGEKELEQGGEGDDEGDDIDEDEMMEKTAVTHAMEQLLKDIDHKNINKELVTSNNALNDSSDSAEAESFVEGRLSPSANKTRKFRMKRHARQKGKRQRSGRLSQTSESEAARTDPTTDNSQTRSSMSRSPSADIESNGELQLPPAPDEASTGQVTAITGDTENVAESEIPDEGQGSENVHSGLSKVSPDRECEIGLADTNIDDLEIDTQTAEDDTLRQVLESVARMPDLSESSDLDNLVFANIDERFVTDRRKKKLKPLKSKSEKGEKADEKLESKAESSFSISTPSESETSVSSVDEFAGLILDVKPGEEDEAPDEDMLKDYQTTMSLALEESFSDGEQVEPMRSDNKEGENRNEGNDIASKDKNLSEEGVEDINDQVGEFEENYYSDKTETDRKNKEVAPNEKTNKNESEKWKTETKAAPLATDEFEEDIRADLEKDQSETTLLSTDTSVYATPDVSVDKRYSGLGVLNDAILCSPTNDGRKRLSSNVEKPPIAVSSVVSIPSAETPLRTSGVRDSSGSEIYLSPMESFSGSPLANINVATPSHASKGPASQSSPTLVQPGKGLDRNLKQLKTRVTASSPTQPSPTSSTSSIPTPSSSSSSTVPSSTSSASSSRVSSSSTPTSSSSSSTKLSTAAQGPSAKSQRKLPELPKLKMPAMSAAVSGRKSTNTTAATKEAGKQIQAKSTAAQTKQNETETTNSKLKKRGVKVDPLMKHTKLDDFDPPVLSSSPKLPSKSSSHAIKATTNGRVLPKPNLNSSSKSSLSTVNKTKAPVKSNSAAPSTSIATSSSKPTSSSSKATSSSSSSSSVSSSANSTSRPKLSVGSTTTPKPAPFKAPNTKSGVQDKTFSKPISPPVFRPPPKTVVPIDKSKLKLGSSTEAGDSESESSQQKKKISAEGISIGNEIEDIPFADESEAEAKFYTPCAPDKTQNPLASATKTESPRLAARRRVLPSPPSKSLEPAVLTSDQIREIRKADMEKAKLQARERARLKSDEELGISVTDSPKKILSHNHMNEVKSGGHRRNASFDTLSTSDVLSDSDDKLSSPVHSPISSAAERETPNRFKTKENKKKHKTGKARKLKKEKKVKDKEKETEQEKKEKRKSLLALILPGKSADKSPKDNKVSDGTSTDNTPKGSDDNAKGRPSKGTKSSDGKAKTGKGKDEAGIDDPDKTPVSEYKKDLAICSVFHSDFSSRPKERLSNLSKREAHIAPRASIDEFSDSDESHMSISTMRRMDDDLDERVARRLRKIQLKQQRQAQQKRLRMAQEIQRQLEEVEVRQRELEDRGTAVEKVLRGDGPEDEDVDEASLMNEWFSLVHEKNALLRYESELNVRAKELELEDRHARLESEFRDRSRKADLPPPPPPESSDSEADKDRKTDNDFRMEGLLLDELLDVVKQRDSLVAMLEEDRLRERKEDKELQDMMKQKGYVLSPLSYDTRRDRQVTAPLASPVL